MDFMFVHSRTYAASRQLWYFIFRWRNVGSITKVTKQMPETDVQLPSSSSADCWPSETTESALAMKKQWCCRRFLVLRRLEDHVKIGTFLGATQRNRRLLSLIAIVAVRPSCRPSVRPLRSWLTRNSTNRSS